MEDNTSFYRAEYESLLTQLSLLREQLKRQEDLVKEKQALLSECYEIIHYKKLWLTLSDECIEDMQKHMKEGEEE